MTVRTPSSKYPTYFSFIKAGIGGEAANSLISGINQMFGITAPGRAHVGGGAGGVSKRVPPCRDLAEKPLGCQEEGEELHSMRLKSPAHKLQRLTLMYLKEVQWGNWEVTKSS